MGVVTKRPSCGVRMTSRAFACPFNLTDEGGGGGIERARKGFNPTPSWRFRMVGWGGGGKSASPFRKK